MGDEEFSQRVKTYATDVDESALQQARGAAYDEKSLTRISDEIRERYFEPQRDGRLTFRRDLRRAIIFGRNDLTQDAPISRVALLVSRNTLMYFNVDM
jgi:two-component system CheB/CheR fusion protein